MMVYWVFTFHSIRTLGPLFCCKMTSLQQCTVLHKIPTHD